MRPKTYSKAMNFLNKVTIANEMIGSAILLKATSGNGVEGWLLKNCFRTLKGRN